MTETVDQIASSPNQASRADSQRGGRARKQSGGGTGRLVLIVLFLMLMGGAAAWTEVRPYAEPLLDWLPASSLSLARPAQTLPPPEASFDRAAMLEAALSSAAIRLEQAEQRLALVETQLRQATQQRAHEDGKELPPKSLPTPAPASDKTQQSSEAALPANPATLAERPEDLRKKQGERVAKGSLVLLAVRQLRETVDRGTPFETELQVARSLGPGKFANALEFLAPLAQTGIPTSAVLMERYKPSASAALAANSQLGSNWLEGRVSQFFSSAITVRRTDGSGDDNGTALRRAEKLMADGDLIGCVDALRLLQGPAANAMLPWMQAAVSRINADRALSEILSAAITVANESGD
ncbi:Putative membrane protein involved in heme biosynthesis. Conserved among Magnestospirilla in the MAI [Rhodospirillaceae bacterium LM-1]|nr:Putative membrane protein involved in heme biosynthesis. Conserved among Magnestospirilla in the MAI [Rhodospirillaceae bacterium LM-1]